MEHHPVAAPIAAAVAGRDPQRLSAALTETVRLRALLPGGPIESHGREDVAALLARWFADFDTVELVESAGEPVADRLLIHYRLHVTQPATPLGLHPDRGLQARRRAPGRDRPAVFRLPGDRDR